MKIMSLLIEDMYKDPKKFMIEQTLSKDEVLSIDISRLNEQEEINFRVKYRDILVEDMGEFYVEFDES